MLLFIEEGVAIFANRVGAAAFRLEVFDWFFRQLENFSLTGAPDASSLMAPSLENKSTEPKKKRKPEYSRERGLADALHLASPGRESQGDTEGERGIHAVDVFRQKDKGIFEREKKDAPSAAALATQVK